MKRILTYTTALTLLTGPALADAKMDTVRDAQQMLNEYDISVNADTLTDAQLAEIQALDTSDRSKAEMRLEQIVAASLNNTNVSGGVAVPTVAVNVPESDVVQDILDEFDIAADADTLTNGQKAAIFGVDTSDRSKAEMRLEQIVGDASPDADWNNQMDVTTAYTTAPESAVVQDILDEFDVSADADNLSNAQKAEVLAVDTSDRSKAEMRLKQIVSG